jgi:hypothetical protein
MIANTRDDVQTVIVERITAHPRSQQKRIGPSEIGTPCARKLGHKLAGTPQREREPAWRPAVGTAVHEWIETTLSLDNFAALRVNEHHNPRWLLEQTVRVGDIDGTPLTGSADLFDTATGTVVDHKIVGPASLKKYKAGVNHTYRVQAHCYGQGFANAGHAVNAVALNILPSAGELHQAVWWEEEFNPQVVNDALDRANGIAKAGRLAGWDKVLPQLGTADDYCGGCPFYRANTSDLVTGCPGHDGAIRTDHFADLRPQDGTATPHKENAA